MNVDQDQENQIWEKAILENTLISYSKYLSRYPNGQFVEAAKSCITDIKDELDWNIVKASRDPKQIRKHLKDFPRCLHKVEAKELLKEIEEDSVWTQATTEDSIASYKHYLDLYPRGKFHAKAKERIYEIEDLEDWEETLKIDTIEAYRAHMKKFPTCDHWEIANQKIEAIELRKWKQAVIKNTIDGYLEYLDEFPDSRHKKEAYNYILLLEKAEEDAKVASGVPQKGTKPKPTITNTAVKSPPKTRKSAATPKKKKRAKGKSIQIKPIYIVGAVGTVILAIAAWFLIPILLENSNNQEDPTTEETETQNFENELNENIDRVVENAMPIANGPYVIIAGTFTKQMNAERKLQKLKDLGYSYAIVEEVREGQLHRVLAGWAPTFSSAKEIKAKLESEHDVDAFIMKRD